MATNFFTYSKPRVQHDTVWNNIPDTISGLFNQQGTIDCAFLEAGIGGSGDPRRKWERGRESEIVEKCCFCLQNYLKEP